MKKLINKTLLISTFMFIFSTSIQALPCPKGILKYGLRNTSSFIKKIQNNKKLPTKTKKRLWKYALSNKIKTLLLICKCIKTYISEKVILK